MQMDEKPSYNETNIRKEKSTFSRSNLSFNFNFSSFLSSEDDCQILKKPKPQNKNFELKNFDFGISISSVYVKESLYTFFFFNLFEKQLVISFVGKACNNRINTLIKTTKYANLKILLLNNNCY